MIKDDVKILDALAERPKDYGLPREFYTNSLNYQQDLKNIWYEEWVFVGHDVDFQKVWL